MEAHAYRPIICPGCHADDAIGTPNAEDYWYMYCRRCALRFWYNPRR